jgi:hypothetical protein
MKYLSVDEFKKWVKDHNDFNHNIEKKIKPLIGTYVESKSNLKKIYNCLIPEEGKRKVLSKDFFDNGGQVKDVNGETYLIEVFSGSFYISKKHIKK